LHRNSPPPDMGVSPAELLFGRNISDHMPKPVHLRLEWSELADMRERAHAQRFSYATKDKIRHEPDPLSVGDIAYKTREAIIYSYGMLPVQ